MSIGTRTECAIKFLEWIVLVLDYDWLTYFPCHFKIQIYSTKAPTTFPYVLLCGRKANGGFVCVTVPVNHLARRHIFLSYSIFAILVAVSSFSEAMPG